MDKTGEAVTKYLEWVGKGSPENTDAATKARQWAAARAYIEAGPMCHLATIAKDGRPHQSLVWVGIDNDELVIAHLFEYRKVHNVRRDPRVSVSISSGSRNAIGQHEYLVVEGLARVTEGGAPELLQRLGPIYLQRPGIKYPPMDNPPPGWVTHITPTRIRGWGPWQEAVPIQ
jgi:PPOX class probable F420-dependent enzyme